MIDYQGGVSYEPRTCTLSGVSQQPFSAHSLILLHPKNQSVYQKCRSAVPVFRACTLAGGVTLLATALYCGPSTALCFISQQPPRVRVRWLARLCGV